MSESQFEKMAKANQKLRAENARLRAEIKQLHAAIEEVYDEWQSALYSDLEEYVPSDWTWLIKAISKKFAKEYPEISSFGGVLERIFHKCGYAVEEVNDAEVQD